MHGHSDLPTKTAQEGISDAEAWESPLSSAKRAGSPNFESCLLLGRHRSVTNCAR